MNLGTNPEFEGSIAELNGMNATALAEAAESVIDRLFESSYDGVGIYVTQQQIEYIRQHETGEFGKVPFPWVVLHDRGRLPFNEHDHYPTLCMELAPDPMRGEEAGGNEKLVVNVPVDEDVRLDESFFSSSFVELGKYPAFVVLDSYDTEGNVKSFMITRDKKIFAYQSEKTSGERIDPEELTEMVLFNSVSPLNPLDEAVLRLMVQLTNWAVVPQRIAQPPFEESITSDISSLSFEEETNGDYPDVA